MQKKKKHAPKVRMQEMGGHKLPLKKRKVQLRPVTLCTDVQKEKRRKNHNSLRRQPALRDPFFKWPAGNC